MHGEWIFFLFFCRLPIYARSNGGKRADLRRASPSVRVLSIWEKMYPLFLASFASASVRPFLLRGIWDNLTSSKPSCSLSNTSISVAKVGQYLWLVVMSTRSKQSVSNRIEVIILSLKHEVTQSKHSISSCRDERLMLLSSW